MNRRTALKSLIALPMIPASAFGRALREDAAFASDGQRQNEIDTLLQTLDIDGWRIAACLTDRCLRCDNVTELEHRAEDGSRFDSLPEYPHLVTSLRLVMRWKEKAKAHHFYLISPNGRWVAGWSFDYPAGHPVTYHFDPGDTLDVLWDLTGPHAITELRLCSCFKEQSDFKTYEFRA